MDMKKKSETFYFVMKDGNPLCQNLKVFARNPFGTFPECVKVYRSRGHALNMAKKLKVNHVAEIPMIEGRVVTFRQGSEVEDYSPADDNTNICISTPIEKFYIHL
jgi:hypothetical protein